MAAEYYATAQFKTAYLQREIPLRIPVAAGGLKVGEVCYDNSGVLTARHDDVSSDAVAAVALGDYIVAQSDMTVGYGHVPVEDKDYRYSDLVAASPLSAKHVAVYKIVNLDDITISYHTESDGARS